MNVLILGGSGGSGGIGNALVIKFLKADKNNHVYSTYLTTSPTLKNERLFWFRVDISSELEVQNLAQKISGNLDVIINTVGVLHTQQNKPEKTIQEFDTDFFTKNILINTLPTILLAKYFYQHLKASQSSYFVTLSARVGSISDNHLGGWISYRTSKSALNMALKTISIEWKYKRLNCRVWAFHPGTTNTDLSKPFQKNVLKENLLSSSESANYLYN